VFDYPTTAAIATYIYRESTSALRSNTQTNEASLGAIALSANNSDVNLSNGNTPATVVITGVSARLPISTAVHASDAIQVAPSDRWDVDLPLNISTRWTPGRFGGFVQSWASFDNEAFGIAPSEAAFMDPQQRCLLEEASQLIRIRDSGTTTVVAVGIAKLGEPQLVAVGGSAGVAAGSSLVSTGRALSAAAGRLSYAFGLCGPCIAVDTACSSSLVSVGYAFDCMTNASGCDAAIAAGVNLPMNWETSSMFAAAGMMARDGRCKALDAAADGYVRSETCSVIRLDSTVREDESGEALAFLAGIAVNQDGRSSSLTAPHGPSQHAVITAAARRCGIAPQEMHAFEMHGTGTSLGDPIEVGALASLLKGKRHSARAAIGLAAAKSCFGHAETGAGLIGMVSALSAVGMQNKQPIMHLTNVNAYVSSALDGAQLGSFSAARQMAPDPTGGGVVGTRRMVGVSAFAFQGTNAHSILEKRITDDVKALSSVPKSTLLTLRKYYWYAPPPHRFIPAVHQTVLPSIGGTSMEFDVRFRRASLAFLWDHIVGDRSILPAAAMLELGSAAASSVHLETASIMLCGLSIAAPFLLTEDAMQGKVTVSTAVDGASQLIFSSTSVSVWGRSLTYCQCALASLKSRRYVLIFTIYSDDVYLEK